MRKAGYAFLGDDTAPTTNGNGLVDVIYARVRQPSNDLILVDVPGEWVRQRKLFRRHLGSGSGEGTCALSGRRITRLRAAFARGRQACVDRSTWLPLDLRGQGLQGVLRRHRVQILS